MREGVGQPAPPTLQRHWITVETDKTMKIEIELDEVTHSLPARFAVCPECDGHGTHLRPGMRGHCYTSEEFAEAFDDEGDRAAYFEHGGKYDVTCSECKGARVVPEVNEEQLTPAQREVYAEWLEDQEAAARDYADDRATQRAECGGWG